MKKTLYLTLLCLMASCASREITPSLPAEVEVASRPVVTLTTTASISDDADGRGASRIAYQQDGDNLNLSWEAQETLGVYIRQQDGTMLRAGHLTSTGEAGTGARIFSGGVSELREDEQYVYVHPDLGNTPNVNFTTQSGALNSTAHLKRLVPLVWNGPTFEQINSGAKKSFEAGKPTNHAYVIHLHLQFNQNPGDIREVRLITMPMKSNPCEDIFPANYSLTPGVVEKGKSITLNVTSGAATYNETEGIYEADAYLVCTHADVDVYKTKYHVACENTDGKKFYSMFRSFAGQQSASGTLDMLANAKQYNLTAAMSADVCTTEINTQYGIYSLMGMWDNNGKAYDPIGLHPEEEEWPAALRNNKAAIIARYYNKGGAGTNPNYQTLYDTRESGNQENVTFNNIYIKYSTKVFITFLHENGDNGNKDLLGYYYYPGTPDAAAPNKSSKVPRVIIFPNLKSSEEYETVQLLYTDAAGYTSEYFPAGTTIGFYMMINVQAGSSVNNILKWDQWSTYTNSVWNKENSGWNQYGYVHARHNFFTSADFVNGSTLIPGMAFYAAKDRADESGNSTSMYFNAMIFVVSTSDPAAMVTKNVRAFDVNAAQVGTAYPDLIVTK